MFVVCYVWFCVRAWFVVFEIGFVCGFGFDLGFCCRLCMVLFGGVILVSWVCFWCLVRVFMLF